MVGQLGEPVREEPGRRLGGPGVGFGGGLVLAEPRWSGPEHRLDYQFQDPRPGEQPPSAQHQPRVVGTVTRVSIDLGIFG